MPGKITSRKEFSLLIEDGNQLKEILNWMNFKIVGEIEKTREKYLLQNISLNFDNVTHLGNFLEIEILGNEEHAEEQRGKIFQLFEQLGIKEILKKDYLELLWEKGFFKN